MASFLSRTRKIRDLAHRDIPSPFLGGRIPHPSQLRYLGEYLSRTERWILRVATLLVLGGIGVGIWQFATVHLESVPTYGGTYSEGLVGTPKTINPLYLQNNDVDQDIARLVYSSLFRVNEHDQLVPDIATSYELSEDKKTYTIHVRNDVRFHNDTPLTVDDVIFTLRAIQDPSYNSSLRSNFAGAQVARVDDTTLSLTLREPFAPFPSSLTFGILPSESWAAILPEQASLAEFNLKPIGSGPFQFFSLNKDKSGSILSMTLVANERYYNDRAFLDNIEFKFYPDLESSIIAIEDGNVDGISYVPKSRKDEVVEKNDRAAFQSFRLPQYTAVFFNMGSGIFKHWEVREALGRASNKQSLIDVALGGEGTPIHTPILPGQIGHHEGIVGQVFDLDAGRKTLEDNGWKIEENAESENKGLRVKDGKPLRFTLRTIDQPEIMAVAEELERTWEQMNADVTVEAVPAREIQAGTIKNRDYDALLFGIILGPDPDPYPFWHSSQAKHPGLNLSVYKNKTVDGLLEAARETADTNVRVEKYREFQQILANELPAIFLYNPVYTYVHDKKLQGVESTFITRPSDRFRDVTSWYINTKRRFPSGE